jgi:hypothetical protein
LHQWKKEWCQAMIVRDLKVFQIYFCLWLLISNHIVLVKSWPHTKVYNNAIKMAQYYCIGHVQPMLLDCLLIGMRLYVQVSQSVWVKLFKKINPPSFKLDISFIFLLICVSFMTMSAPNTTLQVFFEFQMQPNNA